MGGINHQPCGAYLGISTQISRSISLLQASFWQINVGLENAILSDLGKEDYELRVAIQEIGKAENFANEVDSLLVKLLARLGTLSFQELPETSSVLGSIGDALRKEAVNFSEEVIKSVNTILTDGGFNALFTHYQTRLRFIQNNLGLIRDDLEKLNQTSSLADDCETNQTKIRLNFTRTMLAINELVSEWAFSSLASATMWNVNQDQPTMVPVSLELSTVVA